MDAPAFVIAIPSYQRSALFAKNTYDMLKRYNLLDVATLFINPADEEAYKDIDINKVVKDCKSLGERRDFIYNHYPDDTNILQMDDDISKMISKNNQEFDLRDLIQRGFDTARKEGCRLWGLYPVPNPFFMKDGQTTDLKYISGCFFGLVKKGNYVSPPTEGKGDFWWSCWYFMNDKKVLRINDYSAKANFYSAKGGREVGQARIDAEIVGANRVVADFPNYATQYIRKTTGFAELRLRNKCKAVI